MVPDRSRVRVVGEDAGSSEWTKGCSRYDKSDLFRGLWTGELSDAMTIKENFSRRVSTVFDRVRMRESLCSLVSS